MAELGGAQKSNPGHYLKLAGPLLSSTFVMGAPDSDELQSIARSQTDSHVMCTGQIQMALPELLKQSALGATTN
jgi:hypothetical protein